MSTHDDEQLENMKRFWDDYGTPILVGSSIALAVFAGWRYWQQSKLETASQAAGAYQRTQEAYQKLSLSPDDKEANTELQREAQKLIQEYATTPYALNAALLLAKRGMENKDLKEAEKQLRWVLTQPVDDGVKSIATLRLAQLFVEKGDNKGALELLAKDTNAAFTPSRDELRGDILKTMGDVAGAQKAYQSAVKALVERNEPRPLLEMKMADVGLVAPEIKRPSPIKPEAGA
ncbi:MAG: tetratricopeptide repeat protein [Agitococcus sp.]|nr:tetratricopeptide repeat protein [Agitococcus sp.]